VVINYWHNAPDQRVFIAMVCVPVLFLAFIRHLKVLAWCSVVANIATVASLGFIFWYSAQASKIMVINGDFGISGNYLFFQKHANSNFVMLLISTA